MGIFESYQKQAKQAVEEETRVHEQYCLDLLKKHMLEPDRHKVDRAMAYDATAYLETLGYKIEKWVTDRDGNSEIYQWKLYKLIDSSPKYRIKRVVSVVEADDKGNGLVDTDKEPK